MQEPTRCKAKPGAQQSGRCTNLLIRCSQVPQTTCYWKIFMAVGEPTNQVQLQVLMSLHPWRMLLACNRRGLIIANSFAQAFVHKSLF